MNGAAAIGDGIFQIPVPITDNPLGHTLVYAMESPGGLILVDAGWGDDNGWQGLNAGLAEIGHSVTDIEGVVVTHFHPDHTGLRTGPRGIRRLDRHARGRPLLVRSDGHCA